MKNFLCNLLFACLLVSYQSGAQSWAWATNFAILDEGGHTPQMAMDVTGNVVTGGTGFLAKYSAGGALVWRKDVASGFKARVKDVCTDAAGNIIVVGTFWDTLSLGATTLISAGFYDFFIVKYDGSGNALWAKTTGDKYINSVATDAAGNVFVGGSFDTSITFDATTLTDTLGGMYLVKFSPAGSVLWGETARNGGANAIAVDNSGNVLVTGVFAGTVTMGSTTLTSVASSYPLDVFVAKYSGTGSVMWAKSAASNHYDVPFDITVDGAGNCYVTGVFQGTSMVAGAITLPNASVDDATDIFVLSYDASGAERWGKRLGNEGYNENLAIAADNAGNVYIAPYYRSTTISFGSTTLYNAGEFDVMIAKFNTLGVEQWAINVGGTSNDLAYALAADNTGNIHFMGGTASSTLTLGSTTLSYTGSFYGDIVVGKLSEETGLAVMNVPVANVTIYPNPVNNELTISADEPITSVRIIDVCGRQVYSKMCNSKEVRIGTKALAAGAYQLIINNAAKQRFIKE